MKHRTLRWTSTLLALFVLAGCNTLEGLGQDVEEAGEEIEEEA